MARRLDEGEVGARLDIERRARERVVEAGAGDRVGAGDDQEIGVGARIDRGLHLLRHLARRDHGLAGEMAAALGELLILELDGVGARALQHLHRVGNVHRIAEAGIGIDDERYADAVAHRRDMRGELGERDEADIGHAEIGIGDARAGDIDGGEAKLLDHPRRERVGGARHDDARALDAGCAAGPC